MVVGYLILRCSFKDWKGCHVHRGFQFLRPEFIHSVPISVLYEKNGAVMVCRKLNLQQKGIFVYYYYPINLYSYEKDS